MGAVLPLLIAINHTPFSMNRAHFDIAKIAISSTTSIYENACPSL